MQDDPCLVDATTVDTETGPVPRPDACQRVVDAGVCFYACTTFNPDRKAVENEQGQCELAPACDDASCDGLCVPDVECIACYSPEHGLDHAYDSDYIGCPCDPATDLDTCVTDSTGRQVALSCPEGNWQSLQDGACGPTP
jgi:hypothetical protein